MSNKLPRIPDDPDQISNMLIACISSPQIRKVRRIQRSPIVNTPEPDLKPVRPGSHFRHDVILRGISLMNII